MPSLAEMAGRALSKAVSNLANPGQAAPPEPATYTGKGHYGRGSLLLENGTDLTGILEAPGGAPAVILGIDGPGRSTGLSWDPSRLQGHALTFGATRSGKGVSAIVPALLTYAGSVLVVDPKGEAVWVAAERRRQMGQRVVILDPWNETNRRYSGEGQAEVLTRFNPLSALDPNDPQFVDDVTAIADALIVPGQGDPHWTDSARELVGGLPILRPSSCGNASGM